MTGNHSESFQQAASFLTEGSRFLVVSHVHPDGDAIGSTLAVKGILEKLGKEAVMVNASPIPYKFRFLPECEAIVQPQDISESFDGVVAVDVADRERMGAVLEMLPADLPLLNIDHHSTNDRFGTVNLVVDDAAATTQILFRLVQTMKLPLGRELAVSLYTGLVTDTGGFRYSNTTPAVMEMAASLLRCGVDAGAIADQVLETMTRGQLALLKRALSTLQFSLDGRIAWIWLSRHDLEETEAEADDWDGIVNYARNVAGVDVGILFRETEEGQVKVSLRSREVVDVAVLAHVFGGGGHARAAGCTLSGNRSEVENRLLEQVKEALGEGGV
jgi:phosphoesterase RecJ-like protein